MMNTLEFCYHVTNKLISKSKEKVSAFCLCIIGIMLSCEKHMLPYKIIRYLIFYFPFSLQMHSGNSLAPENPAFSISTGIAALIIEGRPLYDEEYAIDSSTLVTQRRQREHPFPSSALKYYRTQPTSPPQNLLGTIYSLQSIQFKT